MMIKFMFISVVAMALIVQMVYAGEYVNESVLFKVDSIKMKWIAEETLLFKNETSPSRYSVANLNDSDINTAWVTRLKENGGIWLKMIFEKPVYVKNLYLRNGYQKSKNLFLDNARVKQLVVEKIIIGDENQYPLDNTFNVDDTINAQELSLEKRWTESVNLFKTQELRIYISDVYNGRISQDVCISELSVSYSNEISYTPSVSWDELNHMIKKNKFNRREGWDWSGMLANDYQLFNDLLYYVLTGNEEAYSVFSLYKPEGTSISAAMDFLYRNAVTKSLQGPIGKGLDM